MQVQFFFAPGSRYSYLAAGQLARISAATGAVFAWRAVFTGDLTARAGGAPRSPQDPAWRHRDVARWARHYGMPYVQPAGDCDWRAVAIACVAAAEHGAGEAFGRAMLHLVHAEGVAPDERRIQETAERCELDGAALVASSRTPQTAAAYEANLDAAAAAGAFGVPTFVTETGAAVWGQDRLPLLEDCIRQGDLPL